MPPKQQRKYKNEDFCQRALLGWEIMQRKPDLFELWGIGLRAKGNFALTADGFELNCGGFPSVRVWKTEQRTLEVTLLLSPIHKFNKQYALCAKKVAQPFQDIFFDLLPTIMEDISDALQQETEKSRASGDWYGQERKSRRNRASSTDGQIDEQQPAA